MSASVQVNTAQAVRTVAVRERHGLLEHVAVVAFVGLRRIGSRYIQHIAQLGQKELVVGAFGSAAAAPAGDEEIKLGGGRGHGRER
jgi:hypothetical protein